MKTYYVTYKSTTDGDCCTVWTNANSKQQAIDYTKSEYWDVGDIIEVIEK